MQAGPSLWIRFAECAVSKSAVFQKLPKIRGVVFCIQSLVSNSQSYPLFFWGDTEDGVYGLGEIDFN